MENKWSNYGKWRHGEQRQKIIDDMSNKLDKQYTDLLKTILEHGVDKKDRTGTGTKSIFGYTIRHNMKDGFPLLTTKKMPFKTIVTELLWFLRGDTNIKYLVDNNCHIWDGDAYKNYCNQIPEYSKQFTMSKEEYISKIKTDDEFANKWGELGPIYGKQWRKWEDYTVKPGLVHRPDGLYNENYVDYDQPIDQIANLINELKTNPDSRRLMVNAWNVGELDQMVLPPCHYGFQVYTRELTEIERYVKLVELTNRSLFFLDYGDGDVKMKEFMKECDELNIPTRAISLMWNQRSVDTFLGLPFNIASYGLLLEIIAKEVNMVPDQLIGNLGDVHLYSNHIEQAKEQIGRELSREERYNLMPSITGHSEKNIKIRKKINNFEGNIPGVSYHEEWLDSFSIPKRTREPFPLPTLKFRPCPITGIDIEYLSIAQFEIENYQSHSAIKAPLSN